MPSRLEIVQREITRTRSLIEDGYLLETMDQVERMVEKNPQVPEAHIAWRRFMNQLAAMHFDLGKECPEAFEFGVVYEKLKTLGWVSLPTQVLAVQHYRETGKKELAEAVYQALVTIAPNHLTIKAMIRKQDLANSTVVPYSVFKELQETRDRRQGSETLALDSDYVKLLEETLFFLETSDFQKALECADKNLVNSPSVCATSAEFHYIKAYSLARLDRYLEAVPLIYQLAETFPENQKYTDAYSDICERAWSFAVEHSKRDITIEQLKEYQDLLFNYFFVPIELLVAMVRSVEGIEEKSRWKNQFVARLILSPNDTDYLSAALNLVRETGDFLWMRELKEKIRDLIKDRPHDLNIKGLFGQLMTGDLK